MILKYDDDVYTANADGGRLLANQAAKAKTTTQIASLDGTSPAWTPLGEPCLLLVSRGRAIHLSGADLDKLISACNQDGDFVVGHPQAKA